MAPDTTIPTAMRLAAVAVKAAAAALVVAGCGSAGAAPASGSPSSSADPGRRPAAGEVMQLAGNTLVLSPQNAQSGDITVTFSPSTTVRRTSTGSVADIVTGTCIFASGQKDATGTLSATTVVVTAAQAGGCSSGRPGAPGEGGPGGGSGLGGGNGSGGNLPRRSPSPGQPNAAFTGGQVTSVQGTSVTVQPPTGGAPQTITVPTTVRVSRSVTGSTSDLAVGQCISANGKRDSSGKVAATNLTIVPAGPNGCFTGSGPGGFGGRRGSGGGMGGPAAG